MGTKQNLAQKTNRFEFHKIRIFVIASCSR